MHHYMTAHQLAEEIRKGNTSASEIARSTMERIERLDPEIGAYITTTGDRVLEAANRVDERLAKGEAVPPLAGIPMAIMDNICTQGILTTCASRMLHNFIPPYSADAYERLERAGSVLTGKTNLDEFAMGSSTQGSAFKKTYNPWDLGKVPGVPAAVPQRQWLQEWLPSRWVPTPTGPYGSRRPCVAWWA